MVQVRVVGEVSWRVSRTRGRVETGRGDLQVLKEGGVQEARVREVGGARPLPGQQVGAVRKGNDLGVEVTMRVGVTCTGVPA